MKNKLGLVITDGVGYRNFILSDFINQSKDEFEKIIIFSCLPKKIFNNLPTNIIVEELPVFSESFFTWFFRKFKETAHLKLHRNGNFGINDCYTSNISYLKTNRGYATRLIYIITKLMYSEGFIRILNSLQQLTFKSNVITKYYINLLKKYNVDYLLFTHQRPPYIAPIIYASKKQKITSGTFIFSWDNIASKGRMAGDFDTYLVWSKLMKNELLRFYTSINESQIKVVGTPQFEPYILRKYDISKEELFKKLDLDINIKTILFTCNDSSSVNDPIYLTLLAQAIVNGELVKKVNLIVRTSPAEDPTRFTNIASKFKFIKWNYPEWNIVRENHQEAWSQRVPTIYDIKILKGLLKNCDICINVLSTITIDAFIFDKPVINPVFGNKINNFWDDQKFLEYLHLSRLVDSQASIIAKNYNDFISEINTILNGKDEKVKARKEFVKLQIEYNLKTVSSRIVKSINDFI